VENRIHRAHGPHLCEHRPLSAKTSGPSSPEMHDPKRWRPSRRQPPPQRGVLRCTVTQARRASRPMVVAPLLWIPAATPVSTLGRVESRTANWPARVARPAQSYISCDDEKAWAGAVGSARDARFPQREPHCHGGQLESRVRGGAKGRSSFWSGGWIAAQIGRRTGVVGKRTLRSLDDWLVPACYSK